jgi:hypothetical protein
MRFPLATAVTFAVLFMFPSPGRAQGADGARRFGSHGLDDR